MFVRIRYFQASRIFILLFFYFCNIVAKIITCLKTSLIMSAQALIISLMTGTLLACSSSDQKDSLRKEAAHYHQLATEIQTVVESQLDQVDSLKILITARKNPNATAMISTLDSLKMAFTEWEENLVEVPGMPHSHAHEHGEHHHTDATLKDLPADQMRDLQREILKSIQRIKNRLDTLTKSIRS